MEAIENMKTRRSIRKFKPDAVPQELMDKIIERDFMRRLV